jgi:hypothetical protein
MHTSQTIEWRELAAKLVAAQTAATMASSQAQSKQTAEALARKLFMVAGR